MVQHPPSLITTIESKFSTTICFDDLLKFVARTCTIANLANFLSRLWNFGCTSNCLLTCNTLSNESLGQLVGKGLYSMWFRKSLSGKQFSWWEIFVIESHNQLLTPKH
jgi:hypothetical protein